jgi:small-conductance mechanosensitive channel
MTIRTLLEFKLIETENLSLTFYQVLVFVLILFLTWFTLKILNRILTRKTRKHNVSEGSRYAFFQIIKYLIWIIAIGIALETIGIKLNFLIAGSAALLVGVGMGLQQIFADYLSGILILFEGNVKINDVVQVDDMIGKVKHIGPRTSKIETRNNFMVIVPNHRYIFGDVINWSHTNVRTRFHIDVGIAYGSDVKLVEKVLLQCAKGNHEITEDPAPFVRFNDFGNSSLDFQLFFWTDKSFEVENIKSNLRFSIDKMFRENNITIPFPQRDVHIQSNS